MGKKTPEINSSSTADMAFLLLCFFMMTTTMDQDKGLQRRLPPMPDPNQKAQDQKVNRRNIIVVKINLLVLCLLIWIRHRRQTALKTLVLIHGGSHHEETEQEERHIRR